MRYHNRSLFAPKVPVQPTPGEGRITPNSVSTVRPRKIRHLSMLTVHTSCYTSIHRVAAKKVIVDNNFFRELPGKMITVFNRGYTALNASSSYLCRASTVHVLFFFSRRLSAFIGSSFHPGILRYGNMHTERFLIYSPMLFSNIYL